MSTPVYLGATSGSATRAAQVNQFLGTHQANFIYVGASGGSSTTLAGTGTNSNGLYIAQQFTPGSGQTIQRWLLDLSVTGSPTPWTFTIQTDNAGAPSGTVLSTTIIPSDYLTSTPTVVSIPTAQTTFTAATRYWFVFNAVGDVSNFFTAGRTTAVSGVSTSTNGTTWTAQGYGLYYNRFDTTTTGNLTHTYEDSGARWTTFAWNANETPSSLDEYTVAQGTNGYVYSGRSFTYSNGSLTILS